MSVPNPPAAVPEQLPPPPAPAGAAAPAQKHNVVALVAMIVALVGFVFACIPGALMVGWILLPIAFVLSIVSLFLKGDRKWMGVVGLIVSIVGTIVGFIVFFALMATSIDQAIDEEFGSGETTVTETTGEEAATDDEEPAADDAEQGTRENPYPLASKISSDDWTVVINSHTADGAALVAKNEFNDKAPAGSHYEVINYTVTYTGDDKGLAPEVSIAFVTASGNVINSYDAMVMLEDGFGLDELYNGASATGSEAFLVPDGEKALIRVSPGMFADEVFVQP